MSSQRSGYDRVITVFSPDGRLIQVEYATETVKQGSPSIGLVAKDGVVLGSEERLPKYADPELSRKLHVIDEHVGAAIAGYVPDGRRLLEQAREFSQSHRMIYDEKPSLYEVARNVADIMQNFTQTAATRPFGVSLVIGGVDETKEKSLYVTDPSGSLLKQSGAAIGNGAGTALEFLYDNYDEEMDLEEVSVLVSAALTRVAREEEPKIRLIQIKQEPIETRLLGLEASLVYLERAKESYPRTG